MNKAFIALGTNIEPRKSYLDQALVALEEQTDIKIIKESSIYETEPVGYLDQKSFLNMVIEVDTTFSAIELLDYCQSIEQELGRERTIRFGPRTIDLDIIVYNQEDINTDRLTLPHPRMHERAFVLIPFNEIAPDLLVKGFDKRINHLTMNLSENDKHGVLKSNLNDEESK